MKLSQLTFIHIITQRQFEKYIPFSSITGNQNYCTFSSISLPIDRQLFGISPQLDGKLFTMGIMLRMYSVNAIESNAKKLKTNV